MSYLLPNTTAAKTHAVLGSLGAKSASQAKVNESGKSFENEYKTAQTKGSDNAKEIENEVGSEESGIDFSFSNSVLNQILAQSRQGNQSSETDVGEKFLSVEENSEAGSENVLITHAVLHEIKSKNGASLENADSAAKNTLSAKLVDVPADDDNTQKKQVENIHARQEKSINNDTIKRVEPQQSAIVNAANITAALKRESGIQKGNTQQSATLEPTAALGKTLGENPEIKTEVEISTVKREAVDERSREANKGAVSSMDIDVAKAVMPDARSAQLATLTTQAGSSLVGELSDSVSLSNAQRIAAELKLNAQQNASVTLTSLKMQLKPENLGMVTATMQLDGDQLLIKVQVEKQEAYRQLNADNSSIVKALQGQGYSIDQVTIQMASSEEQQSGEMGLKEGSDGKPFLTGEGEQNRGGSKNNDVPSDSASQARTEISNAERNKNSKNTRNIYL